MRNTGLEDSKRVFQLADALAHFGDLPMQLVRVREDESSVPSTVSVSPLTRGTQLAVPVAATDQNEIGLVPVPAISINEQVVSPSALSRRQTAWIRSRDKWRYRTA